MAYWHKEESASGAVGRCGAYSLSGSAGWEQRRILANSQQVNVLLTSKLLSHEWLICSVQGFRDLVWLPIEQYRKDGRIVRGFQRGTASFGTSTAMAALELTNRMVRTIQVGSPWTLKSGFPPVYHFLRMRNISGSSRDSLRHGVSSPWWERHQKGKTVHPLRTGSSARRPARGRGQSLHCRKRGKLLLNCSWKQELIVKIWRFYINRALQTRHWPSMTQPPGSTNSVGWQGQWAEFSASCHRRWWSRSLWPPRPPLMS